jgi:hypothetical protein
MVYEERGRGIICQNGQGVVIDPEAKRWLASEHEPVKVDIAEWHEYTVIAQGNHLIHKIDGQVTIDLLDFELAKRSLEGLLAFQIHRGPAMKVQIKDVMLKELPDGGVIVFDELARSPPTRRSSKPRLRRAKPRRRTRDRHLLSSFVHHSNAYHEEISLPESPAVVTPRPANALRPGQGTRSGQRRRERQGQSKAKAKPNRPQAVGPAIGANVATPVSNIKTLKDFKVELFTACRGRAGLVGEPLHDDDKGRIYASDQYGMSLPLQSARSRARR